MLALAVISGCTNKPAPTANSETPTVQAPVNETIQNEEEQRKEGVEAFIVDLNMDKEQADKVRNIYADFVKEKDALQYLKDTNRTDYQAKVRALGEGYVKQINEILSPAQQKKFEEILAKRDNK